MSEAGGFGVAVTGATALPVPAGGRRRSRLTDVLEPVGSSDAGSAAGCGCAVLDRPGRVDRYTPSSGQRRFVRARDRTCRHPGCRSPAARTDLDHVLAHGAGGVTECVDLCRLCRRHHRIKTHAPGWRSTMSPDGVLTVTTPSGATRTTRPPGLRTPADATADDPPPFRRGPHV